MDFLCGDKMCDLVVDPTQLNREYLTSLLALTPRPSCPLQNIDLRQPRIAKIERAAPDVSLDQLIRAFVAAGGRLDVQSKSDSPKSAKRKPKTVGRVAKRFILESSASK